MIACRETVGGHSHDASDQIDSALELSTRPGAERCSSAWRAWASRAVLQAGVVMLSGSVALLGDTLHNVADALTAVPLLVAFTLARRPPNKRYTYGYGRAEDLGGLFVIRHDWPLVRAGCLRKPSTGCSTPSRSATCGRWPSPA